MARNTYVKTSTGWEQIASTVLAIPQGLVPIVPTSVVNGSTTGDGQITFSAASTISVNGVFDSTFETYLVTVNITTTSSAMALGFRMRAGGTDNSASSYITTLNGVTSGGTAANIASSGTSNILTYLPTGYAGGSANLTVINPAVASATKILAATSGSDSGYTQFTGRSGSLLHNVSSAFDGFTIQSGGAATLTGSIRVYGYSKGGLSQPQTITPYSMAAGNTTVTGSGATTATATVTFPVGRFSVAPIVTTSFTQGSIYISNANNITSTGFTMILRDRNDAAISGSFTTNWQATQMTSSTAAG